MTGTLLVLSRHGQTVWHGENRYAGHSDIDMTPDGHGQAQLLSQWAQRVRPGAIACSPVRRATETAAPAALALGLTPLVLPDLMTSTEVAAALKITPEEERRAEAGRAHLTSLQIAAATNRLRLPMWALVSDTPAY